MADDERDSSSSDEWDEIDVPALPSALPTDGDSQATTTTTTATSVPQRDITVSVVAEFKKKSNRLTKEEKAVIKDLHKALLTCHFTFGLAHDLVADTAAVQQAVISALDRVGGGSAEQPSQDSQGSVAPSGSSTATVSTTSTTTPTASGSSSGGSAVVSEGRLKELIGSLRAVLGLSDTCGHAPAVPPLPKSVPRGRPLFGGLQPTIGYIEQLRKFELDNPVALGDGGSAAELLTSPGVTDALARATALAERRRSNSQANTRGSGSGGWQGNGTGSSDSPYVLVVEPSRETEVIDLLDSPSPSPPPPTTTATTTTSTTTTTTTTTSSTANASTPATNTTTALAPTNEERKLTESWDREGAFNYVARVLGELATVAETRGDPCDWLVTAVATAALFRGMGMRTRLIVFCKANDPRGRKKPAKVLKSTSFGSSKKKSSTTRRNSNAKRTGGATKSSKKGSKKGGKSSNGKKGGRKGGGRKASKSKEADDGSDGESVAASKAGGRKRKRKNAPGDEEYLDNDNDDDDDDDDDESEFEERSPKRGRKGSSKGKTRGKGKAAAEEEDDDDVEMDGEHEGGSRSGSGGGRGKKRRAKWDSTDLTPHKPRKKPKTNSAKGKGDSGLVDFEALLAGSTDPPPGEGDYVVGASALVGPAAPTVWVEVWSPASSAWLCVCSSRNAVGNPDQLPPGPVSYVLAFDGGYVTDVTKRYAHRWSEAVQVRDEAALKELMESCNERARRRPRKRMIEAEREVLEEYTRREPIPTAKSAFRHHPIYALRSCLTSHQVIYPEGQVLGKFRNEDVVPRDCVQEVYSESHWKQRGRVIKPGAEPAKTMTRTRRRRGDVPQETTVELYGRWQTQPFERPIASGGKVPKTERGDVELWNENEDLLPIGTVWIRHSRARAVVCKLGFDFADAFIGFDNTRRGPIPRRFGVVICEEYEDIVLEALTAVEQVSIEKDCVERAARVGKRWRTLARKLLLRDRLKRDYFKK